MRSYEQRRNPARLFLRRLGLLALLALALVALGGVWNVYQKERESAGLRMQAESERADLAERELRLKDDIAELKTDRGMEEALREQYALAEKGEHLIVIVEPTAPAPVEATSTFRTWFESIFQWW
jgi:cell division protein FtsB